MQLFVKIQSGVIIWLGVAMQSQAGVVPTVKGLYLTRPWDAVYHVFTGLGPRRTPLCDIIPF